MWTKTYSRLFPWAKVKCRNHTHLSHLLWWVFELLGCQTLNFVYINCLNSKADTSCFHFLNHRSSIKLMLLAVKTPFLLLSYSSAKFLSFSPREMLACCTPTSEEAWCSTYYTLEQQCCWIPWFVGRKGGSYEHGPDKASKKCLS